jgi:hypothetical protein
MSERNTHNATFGMNEITFHGVLKKLKRNRERFIQFLKEDGIIIISYLGDEIVSHGKTYNNKYCIEAIGKNLKVVK